MRSAPEREELRARAEITSHFAAGPQARWRGASDELYPGRYVRSEQQSQRACGPQPEGARRRAGICFVAAPRRCPTSTASRRLASARPALAPKCEFISARALRPKGLTVRSLESCACRRPCASVLQAYVQLPTPAPAPPASATAILRPLMLWAWNLRPPFAA